MKTNDNPVLQSRTRRLDGSLPGDNPLCLDPAAVDLVAAGDEKRIQLWAAEDDIRQPRMLGLGKNDMATARLVENL